MPHLRNLSFPIYQVDWAVCNGPSAVAAREQKERGFLPAHKAGSRLGLTEAPHAQVEKRSLEEGVSRLTHVVTPDSKSSFDGDPHVRLGDLNPQREGHLPSSHTEDRAELSSCLSSALSQGLPQDLRA